MRFSIEWVLSPKERERGDSRAKIMRFLLKLLWILKLELNVRIVHNLYRISLMTAGGE